MVHFIKIGLRVVLAVGLIVALGALLAVILLVLLGLIELIGRPPRPLDYGGSLDTPARSHPAAGDAMPAGQPPSSVQRCGAATGVQPAAQPDYLRR